MIILLSIFNLLNLVSHFLQPHQLHLFFFLFPLPTSLLASNIPQPQPPTPCTRRWAHGWPREKGFSLLSLPRVSYGGFERPQELSTAASPKEDMRWCSNRSLFLWFLILCIAHTRFLILFCSMLFRFSGVIGSGVFSSSFTFLLGR